MCWLATLIGLEKLSAVVADSLSKVYSLYYEDQPVPHYDDYFNAFTQICIRPQIFFFFFSLANTLALRYA